MSEQSVLLKQEVHKIVGCAMEIINTLGHGFHEKIYENALAVDFRLSKLPFQQQPEFPVVYKTIKVGKYIPDLICYEQIIVDTKTIEQITDREVGQMINYLKITKLRVGLLINFKHAKLEWKRVAL